MHGCMYITIGIAIQRSGKAQCVYIVRGCDWIDKQYHHPGFLRKGKLSCTKQRES